MSQKPTHRKNPAVRSGASKSGPAKGAAPKSTTSSEPWSKATNLFLAGCVAEFYVLLVRHFYINGNIHQVVAWDDYLKYIAYAGLGLLAVGVLLILTTLKKPGWLRTSGWILAGAGVFLAAANWMIRTYYSTAVTFLCAIVPAAMLLGILWLLYDRECAWSLTVLGMDIVVLWALRKGLNNDYWRTRVLIGGVLFLIFLAVTFFLVRRVDKQRGMLGKFRVLPEQADPLPVYVACGISAVSVALAFLSTAVAYYVLWAVAVIVFAIAVYYTVKQL